MNVAPSSPSVHKIFCLPENFKIKGDLSMRRSLVGLLEVSDVDLKRLKCFVCLSRFRETRSNGLS